MASCTPVDGLNANDTLKRPCKGARVRYRRLAEATASQIEADPTIFDMDAVKIDLPAYLKKNPWLKQKFMRRMENVKQKVLAEWQQSMYVPAMVEFQDGLGKAFTERSTSKGEPPHSFEKMNVAVGNVDREELPLVAETDEVGPVRILHSESYDAPATAVIVPRTEDISLPMKLLSCNHSSWSMNAEGTGLGMEIHRSASAACAAAGNASVIRGGSS